MEPQAPAAIPPTVPGMPVLRPEDIPDLSNVVTEDDTPVDSIFSEKQQRLLTEPLYSSWVPDDGQPFLALANVGLFFALKEPPLVPDAMLTIGVKAADDPFPKENRSFFVWVFGKQPDASIEVVSNLEGGEADRKLTLYARIGIPYYIIYDPEQHLSRDVLRVFTLRDRRYAAIAPDWLPAIGLGLKLWEGKYEGLQSTWLRWCDRDGQVIPTGAEKAAQEQQRAKTAEQRAETAEQRAETAEQRAETAELRAQRLAEKLRTLGVDPANG